MTMMEFREPIPPPRLEQLKRLIQGNDPSVPGVRAYAELAFRARILGKTFHEGVEQYLNLCSSIMNADIAFGTGEQWVGRMIIAHLPVMMATEMEYEAEEILSVFAYVNDDPDEVSQMFAPYMEHVAVAMEEALRARQALCMLAADLDTPEAEIEPLIEAYRSSRRELTDGIRIARRYGIKPVYVVDGYRKDAAWVIRDYQELHDASVAADIVTPQFSSQPIATVDLTYAAGLKNLGVRVLKKSPVEGLPSLGLAVNYETFGNFSVLADGEMSVCVHMGAPWLQEYARKSDGKTLLAYEKMAFDQAMRLYDLTVPMTVMRRTGSYPTSEFSRKPRSGEVTASSIRDFVAPRLLLLEAVKDIERELEREVEEGERDLETRKRHISEHTVDGHIRRLPQGYKPSAQAVERARAYGIHLKENETFVSSHKRGKGNEIVVHRLRQAGA